MKTFRFALSLTAVALIAGGCGGGSASPSSTRATEASPAPASSETSEAASASGAQVAIEDFAFAPGKTMVGVGDTVVWTNEDDILHTVTSGRGQKQGVPGVTEDKDAKPDGLFDQEIEFNDTVEFTFDEAGTFKYFCAIHPGMVGTIIVR